MFRRTYDHAGRCVAIETFEGVVMTAGFDAANRAIWLDGPFGRETRAYIGEQLQACELSDGTSIEIERRDGRLSTTTASISLVEEFDGAGQIILDRQGDHEARIAWAGGRVHDLLSTVGLPVSYRYDVAGRPTSLTVGATTVRCETTSEGDRLLRLGETLVLRTRHGVTSRLTYQLLSRSDPRTSSGLVATRDDPNLVTWRSYSYDQNQCLRTEHRADGTKIAYEVDLNLQVRAKVVEREGVTATEQIRYDAAGSPLLHGVRFDERCRPIALGNESFEYDEAGRLVARESDAGRVAYVWDATSNLVRVERGDLVVEMDYDGRGRRVAKRVLRDGVMTTQITYVWSNHVVLHEVDSITGNRRTYIRWPDAWEPIGHVDVTDGVEKPCFYLNDPSGAVEVAFDAAGLVVWEAEHSVFGAYDVRRTDVQITARLVNQWYDEDVGLVYNNRRWYEPRLAAYVTPDPLLLAGTLNPRDYAKNPLDWIDPMGLTHVHPGPTNNPVWPPNGHSPLPGHPSGIPNAFAPNGNYLLGPGHWATQGANVNGQWVPGYAVANGALQTQQGDWPADVQNTVDEAGRTFGCHSCGTRNPGTASGHFIPDHQPQANGVRHANANSHSVAQVRLYPHCLNCSRSQFRQAGRGSRRSRAARAILGGRRNARFQNPNNV